MDKDPIAVVDLSSSDEEGGGGSGKGNPSSSKPPSQKPTAQGGKGLPNPNPSKASIDKPDIEMRSFWRAGNYDAGPSMSNNTFQDHLEHARVHPKFLHSNATSHKWAFGAIAELLDNAVDEISNGATFVKVDRTYNTKDNSPALLFQDDGGGMNPECMRKCMSLGYSSKNSNSTIGQYGNGFKTSTMRLGADVIVFSRATRPGQATQSIGLLSYTFLRTTGQNDVIVPMVDFDISSHWAEPIIHSSQDDWSSNLKTVLEWSPFASKEELVAQFDDIGQHGTKIIIYNLWLNDEGVYELSFDDDDEDIRLRDETNSGRPSKMPKRVVELQSSISYRIRYSLRAYASVLYLSKFTNFHIILRGIPVEQFKIADELKYPKVVVYRPQLAVASKEVSVETTLGFAKEAPAVAITGFNVYHRNRLIRPFWKVTGEGHSQGNGVVGILEANFIEPAHDKQDFERSPLFFRLENKLRQIVLEYWRTHCHLVGLLPPSNVRNEQRKRPVQTSVEVAAHPVHQPIIGLAANLNNDMNITGPGNACRVNVYNESASLQPIVGLPAGSINKASSVDYLPSRSIDEICEENIQLFVRCEEHRQKETELKQTIEKSEEELSQAKRNCAELSSLVELRKKQLIMKQESGVP